MRRSPVSTVSSRSNGRHRVIASSCIKLQGLRPQGQVDCHRTVRLIIEVSLELELGVVVGKIEAARRFFEPSKGERGGWWKRPWKRRQNNRVTCRPLPPTLVPSLRPRVPITVHVASMQFLSYKNTLCAKPKVRKQEISSDELSSLHS